MKIAERSSFRRPAISLASALALAAVVWLAMRGPHDEFATLSGHRGGVFSMALSPDGKVSASGGGDGTVRLWNLKDLRGIAVLPGHKGQVSALAWSPDGETIATGGEDRTIRIGDVTSGKDLELMAELPKPVHAIAFSSDGTILAAAADLQIFYWKLSERRELRILQGHTRPISGMAFLPGGLELVTFAGDKTVRFWDLAKGRPITSVPGPMGHCYGLTISADGKMIACVGGGRVHLYDSKSRKPLDPIEPNARIICGAAFSPDGQIIAIGSQDKEIVVWDILQKKERARLKGHNFAVGQMAFLPDGETLITSSHDSSLKLWKVK